MGDRLRVQPQPCRKLECPSASHTTFVLPPSMKIFVLVVSFLQSLMGFIISAKFGICSLNYSARPAKLITCFVLAGGSFSRNFRIFDGAGQQQRSPKMYPSISISSPMSALVGFIVNPACDNASQTSIILLSSSSSVSAPTYTLS